MRKYQEAIGELKQMLEDAAANRAEEDPYRKSERWDGYFDGMHGAIYRLEMVQGHTDTPKAGWSVSNDGRLIFNNDFKHDAMLRVSGDFEDTEQRKAFAEKLAAKLNTQPHVLQRMTDAELIGEFCHIFGRDELIDENFVAFARAIETALLEKNK